MQNLRPSNVKAIFWRPSCDYHHIMRFMASLLFTSGARVVSNQLSAADHVNSLLASSKSLLYALRVLRVHGILDVSLQEVFRATLLAKMTYACPAWHGMCSAGDHAKLESLVNRCRRLGYCAGDEPEPTLSELCSEADDRMFNGVVINPEHVGYFTSF